MENFLPFATTGATGRRNEISTPKRPPMPNLFGTVLGGAILASGDTEKPPVIRSHSVLPNLGNPTPLHLHYAEQLRDSLPDSVKAAAREPLDAVALIYAMLLSPDEPVRATQLAGLAQRVDPAIQQKTAALFPDVTSAAAHAHLPMINLALGTLRHLTADQFTQFSQTLQWLIESDGKMELFEFVLQKIVLHHLGPQFGQGGRTVVQYYSIKPLVPDCAVLLSALANVSSNDTAEIQKAFDTGMPYLRAPDETDLVLLPREQCDVNQMDAALNRLAQASPTHQKESARSLHPRRRRRWRHFGSGSRTAPRHCRHAGLPDAAFYCRGKPVAAFVKTRTNHPEETMPSQARRQLIRGPSRRNCV